MSRQLTFDLPVRVARGREDFFVSPANAAAVSAIENWAAWPDHKLVLAGPEGAGKTHLAHVWAALSSADIVAATELTAERVPALAQASALVLEDVPEIAGASQETALFHLHNLAREQRLPLLFTGTGPPAGWNLTLPDLASRIAGTQTVLLGPPDDALLAQILAKLFADRQLAPSPAVLDYLVPRMERSFAEARRIVTELDAAALTERRPITRALAATVLDKRPTSQA